MPQIPHIPTAPEPKAPSSVAPILMVLITVLVIIGAYVLLQSNETRRAVARDGAQASQTEVQRTNAPR